MRNFKGRLLVVLVVYFAGFATAIYGLAPVDQSEDNTQDVVFSSFTKSNDFALECGRQFKKWACLAEDATSKAGVYIEAKKVANKITSDTVTGANRTASNGVDGH